MYVCMPQKCAVAGCDNWWRTDDSKVTSYHRFPKDDFLRKVWLSRCCRKDVVNVNEARICSEHFDDDCFEIDFRRAFGLSTKSCRKLKPDAVPSKMLPYKDSTVELTPRSHRGEKRKARILVDELMVDDENERGEQSTDRQPNISERCANCVVLDSDVKNLESECER